VSAARAATLSAALLVTKGNAQPSRGLAQPMTERLGFAMRTIDTRDTRDSQPIEPVAPVTWPGPTFETGHAFAPTSPPSAVGTVSGRITLRVDDKERLRLRLASAHLGKSRQVILTEALEHYFKRVLPAYLHDPCPCIQGGSAIGSDCCQRSGS
jgi:hypothetical protein